MNLNSANNLKKSERNFKRIAFSSFLFTAVFVFNSIASANAQSWTLDTLLNKRTYHDGPNCLNAALAAKEILPELTYVDSVEMKYYLENYCEEKSDTTTYKDLLIVTNTGSIEHAALHINSDKIFEKHAYSGLYGYYAAAEDTLYKIISRKDSDYFTKSQNHRKTQTYSCEAATYIRQNIHANCSAHTDFLSNLKQMRMGFQNISLSENRVYDNSQIPSLEIQNFVAHLNEFSGEDECSVYAFSVGVSTIGSLFHLAREQENNAQVLSLKKSVYNELKLLKEKIEQAQPENEKAQRVLSEFNWGN